MAIYKFQNLFPFEPVTRVQANSYAEALEAAHKSRAVQLEAYNKKFEVEAEVQVSEEQPQIEEVIADHIEVEAETIKRKKSKKKI